MDDLEINPNNTFAIVVGIDNYPKLGDGWGLNNAVREAFEFARWLLEKGLGSDHIRLFVSSVEDRVSLRDRDGNTVNPQDPADIITAILESSFTGTSKDNLLFIYWAGHGSTDVEQRQLLFDQDYSSGNRKVYDLDRVKLALRSDNWKDFPRQIILVNACANDLPYEFNRHQFNDLALNDQSKRKQFTICAASPGEYAGDGAKKEPSEFFKLLLQTLRDHTRGNKLLRLSEVCNLICAGAATLKQTPRIDWINWNVSHFVWSDDALTKLVYAALRRCSIEFTELKRLYQQCIEEQQTVVSVAEIISHLAAEKSSGKNRRMTTTYGPVLDFALHVIVRHKLEALDQELTNLFINHADYERPRLETARKMISEEYRQPVAPLYLSVIPSDADDTFVLYLHDSSKRKMFQETMTVDSKEDFEAAFLRAVRKIEEKLAEHVDQLHFHFFLNVDKFFLELHKWKDPLWESESKMLERQYPIALRFRERVRGLHPATGKPVKATTGRWLSKAKELRLRTFPTRLRINWLNNENGQCSFDDATRDHECVGLFCHPSIETLRAAMEEGLPYLIWPRADCANWSECMKILDEIKIDGALHLAQDHFPRIRRNQRDAHFAVLWDEPDRNPYALSPADATRTKPAFVEII